MRQRLLRDRLSPIEPVLLLYAMKLLFTIEDGMFRPLTCPVYGITTEVIRRVCMDEARMARILHLLVTQGPYCCATLGGFDRGDLLRLLQVQATLVRQQRGDDLLQGMMGWVTATQSRALQDYAAQSPSDFDQAWVTTDYTAWATQAKNWATTLLRREDRDLEWITGPVTQTTSTEVLSLRKLMRDTVEKIAKATRDEDIAQWELRVRDGICFEGGNVSGGYKEQDIGHGARLPLATDIKVDAVTAIPLGNSVTITDREGGPTATASAMDVDGL